MPSTTVTANPQSDEKLVGLARAGDRRAYEQLVKRHSPVVHRVAARIVGHSEADDVAQDSFVRAYYRLDQFHGHGAFRSWLLQVTRSVAINALRKRRPDPTDGIDELAGEDRRGSGLPASSLEEKERRERLELKVTRLSESHRTVLILRDLEGFSYAEIAEITDTPIGSVKGRLHRAREEMIELLRRNTYDWELPDD